MKSMFNQEFDFENQHQKTFDDLKVDFQPVVVLTVTLLRCRNVSVSYFYDKFDTPDPQFRISCPSLPNAKQFNTLHMKPDCPTCEINETFKFVLPEDLKDGDNLPVENRIQKRVVRLAVTHPALQSSFVHIFGITYARIELYDLDIINHDFIGMKSFDAVTELQEGETILKTIDFDSHGELDLEISKIRRHAPDFRFSLGLNDKEKEFRKKRLTNVHEAMKKMLGPNKAPRNIEETPVAALLTSGGGYRAVVGMCGAMEALMDAGLMDMFTYTAGLSGSAWYLMSAYALKGMTPETQKDFHSGLRSRFESNLLLDMINPFTIAGYRKYIAETKERYKQPHSFVDYFPGYLVGKQMLEKENMHVRLSDLQEYVEDAKVPLPIFTSLHVKSATKAEKFHAYLEESPYEVAMPEFGIGMDVKSIGSCWSGGFLTCQRPEMPLHFSQGMTGCAFSILLSTFLKNGNEDSVELKKFIEEERMNGKKTKEDKLMEIESDESDDTDDEDDEDDEDDTSTNHNEQQPPSKPKIIPAQPATSKTRCAITKEIGNISFFTDRNAYIGRSAKMFNFALGFNALKRHKMHPLRQDIKHGAQEQEVIDALGVQNMVKQMTTKKDTISVVDAGILFNVPSNIVLRPQRMTDILIVMDFTANESDDKFSYVTPMSAAAHAWRTGLHFPQVNFEEITNLPPKEFLIFPSNSDECPTVLWFTLSNKAFKNIPDYVPKSKETPPDGKKFNDFPVFDQGGAFSTFKFQYDHIDFDHMREMMYHNVSSHIKEIKDALIEATERKRRRIAKAT